MSGEGITRDEAAEPKRPPIELEVGRVMCPVHGEPFRRRWPSGYPGFVLYAFEALVARPDFQEATGGDQAKIGPLLDRVPMCCRLPKEVLYAVYRRVQEQFHVWHLGRCRVCDRRDAVGGPIKVPRGGGRVRTIDHVCLRCAAFRLERA
jgi:hypothetical protein